MRGGEHLHAAGGSIGQIQGLVIDSGSHQVTHVLLQEGHVFGRKVVAIPIRAVTVVNENGIQLNITRQQVKDPAVRLASATRVSSEAPPQTHLRTGCRCRGRGTARGTGHGIIPARRVPSLR